MLHRTACLAFVSACTPLPAETPPSALRGHVSAAPGVPVVDADVTLIDTGFASRTDFAGAYLLPDVGSGEVTIRIAAAGFAPSMRRVWVAAGAETIVNVRLKAFGPRRRVQLPSTESGAAVQVSDSEGTATLRIEPGDLMAPDGTLVAGDIDVDIVSWDPATDAADLPATLAAADPESGDILPLFSYGTTEAVIRWGGTVVNVTPGETLDWSIRVHESLRAAAENVTPHLWWLNPESGLWEDNGSGSYDAATATFSAALPHLSTWNCDYTNRCTSSCVIIQSAPGIVLRRLYNPLGVPGGDGCYNYACSYPFPGLNWTNTAGPDDPLYCESIARCGQSGEPPCPVGGGHDIEADVALGERTVRLRVPIPRLPCGRNACGVGGCITITIDLPCDRCGEPGCDCCSPQGSRCDTSADCCSGVCDDALCF